LIEKNIKGDTKHVEKPKETLTYIIKSDIDGKEYSMERKGKDGIIEESYYRSRSEEEKKQIIERNKKRRELEKSQGESSSMQQEMGDINLSEIAKRINQENTQTKNFSTSDKKQEEIKEIANNLAVNQQNSLQKSNNNKNIYYGVGLVSLVLLLISMAVVRMKRKR
jgi:hypothetical protein